MGAFNVWTKFDSFLQQYLKYFTVSFGVETYEGYLRWCKEAERILSKYEGGLWMIGNVPADLKYLPERAMKIWFENEECMLPEKDLMRLRDYLVGEIKES